MALQIAIRGAFSGWRAAFEVTVYRPVWSVERNLDRGGTRGWAESHSESGRDVGERVDDGARDHRPGPVAQPAQQPSEEGLLTHGCGSTETLRVAVVGSSRVFRPLSPGAVHDYREISRLRSMGRDNREH